ncbi:kinesin-like protein KIN-UA [Phalaenopsis equestris]|uniref:kinesin-like protein KIN-UA n=1 Tax=Phalaenopsis equestris TaxID=78828 RepID=UPI0009E2ED25|nr:kinesin-like protein KIN-UA [Phalaenopsis equestris]
MTSGLFYAALAGDNSASDATMDLLVKELKFSQEKLLDEEKHRKSLEFEIVKLNKLLSDNRVAFEAEMSKGRGNHTKPSFGLEFASNLSKPSKPRESALGQKATIAKIFEEVGLSKILSLLKSEDLDVQTHAVKVVANLAAEDLNQQRIVEEGGLDALLLLLESCKDEMIQRLTAGAIANLAMNVWCSSSGNAVLARGDPQANQTPNPVIWELPP